MESLMKRRKAIAAALKPLLGNEQTIAALDIFDAVYADGTGFNLLSYVDHLHKELKPVCTRRDLQRALVQTVFLSGEQQEGTQPPAMGEVATANIVFAHMLSGVLDRVAEKDASTENAIRTYLIEKIALLDLAVAEQRALVQWLTRARPDIAVPISREAMRHLLNLAYVLVCEYLGPVDADRLLSEAVKKAETIPEAGKVAPRSLL